MDVKKKTDQLSVVIITDSYLSQQIISESLKDCHNLSLSIFGHTQEALLKINKSHIVPDICVMNESEEQGALLMRQQFPQLKILIVSLDDSKESVVAMLKMGISGYILQHADPDEIKISVEAIQSGKTFFSVGVSDIVQKYLLSQG